MVNSYQLNQETVVLNCDLAAEFPIYIYFSSDKKTFIYSHSINDLLEDSRVQKPLKVNSDALSFLLQSGVVPPPNTAYEDIYILGIGDKAKIYTVNGQVKVEFSHEFPFLNDNRLSAGEMLPDEDLILQMLAEATICRIDKSKPSFLFHSAGKDSNPIAIALAKSGQCNDLTLITHRTQKSGDESKISKSIAEKLGFKHIILDEINKLEAIHFENIREFYQSSPFPCCDNVSLAYPLYLSQLPELMNSNIIDGMGNDVYIGHVPNRIEYERSKLSRIFKKFSFFRRFLPSTSKFNLLFRTRFEWTGLDGLSYKDSKAVYPQSFDVSGYWSKRDTDQDYLEFRASSRGTVIDSEIYMRKVRNFSDSTNSNLIFPWANQALADYFSKLSEKYLVDRKNLKNKLILRKILKKEIDIDSDEIGKLPFSYDSKSLIENNLEWVEEVIFSCNYWEKKNIKKFYNTHKKTVLDGGKHSSRSSDLIYRLLLISLWLNFSKNLAR